MAKILVEEKQINSILKAIEIHISLIESGQVYASDQCVKEKLIKSIEYLKNIPSMIKGNKEIQKMKRQAYYNYLNAKKNLEVANMINDKNVIEQCNKKLEEHLNYYIKLKELYTLMEEGDK